MCITERLHGYRELGHEIVSVGDRRVHCVFDLSKTFRNLLRCRGLSLFDIRHTLSKTFRNHLGCTGLSLLHIRQLLGDVRALLDAP